ncbi:MAG: TonB family protein [Edaphobacter sp.]|uniref:TonB family protein n=1 Tax=Edaphobacter sp. TaxID=1934404 RepID=UPI00238B58F3|nr:TonB family protein [Edaphobacter sp.]MDE1175385.1 TonB family protein [Edaphobacter sp.]
MAAETRWIQDEQSTGENLRGNLVGSLVLHVAIAGLIFGAAYISNRGHNWGENAATAGAIQATMVASLPLPPKQRELDNGVLTSESPSPAPVVAKEKTEPPPKPDEVAVPEKTKPVKQAPQPTPAPPKHPQPTPPQPTKAATGETAGIRIPQSTIELKNGTASAMVQDRTFGARFAYYVNIVNRTVAQNWYTQEADPRASVGKSVTVIFDINRDGTPANPRLGTGSGSPSLDQSAMRAIQRVEGFGPLPAGDRITVEYTFHYTQ